MKMVIVAGPPTAGKTLLLKRVVHRLLAVGQRLAYLKIEVQFSDEDVIFVKGVGYPFT